MQDTPSKDLPVSVVNDAQSFRSFVPWARERMEQLQEVIDSHGGTTICVAACPRMASNLASRLQAEGHNAIVFSDASPAGDMADAHLKPTVIVVDGEPEQIRQAALALSQHDQLHAKHLELAHHGIGDDAFVQIDFPLDLDDRGRRPAWQTPFGPPQRRRR